MYTPSLNRLAVHHTLCNSPYSMNENFCFPIASHFVEAKNFHLPHRNDFALYSSWRAALVLYGSPSFSCSLDACALTDFHFSLRISFSPIVFFFSAMCNWKFRYLNEEVTLIFVVFDYSQKILISIFNWQGNAKQNYDLYWLMLADICQLLMTAVNIINISCYNLIYSIGLRLWFYCCYCALFPPHLHVHTFYFRMHCL